MQEQKTKTKKRYFEPDCPAVIDVFDWTVDDRGHHKLKKVGQKNIDDEIQLWKDQTDIKILIDRYNKKDPATLLQLSQEMAYGDVNDYPQEVHKVAHAQALHTLYENQPDSVKEKFPTYELFESYFLNLTDAMVKEMFTPKEEVKETANEQ